MAAALAEARGVTAESAGVAAHAGGGAAPNAVRAMREARGLDLGMHTPRDVSAVDVESFDWVVALDPSVARRLRSEYEVSDEKLVTWAISDPYGGSLADYRLCLEEIDLAMDELLSS